MCPRTSSRRYSSLVCFYLGAHPSAEAAFCALISFCAAGMVMIFRGGEGSGPRGAAGPAPGAMPMAKLEFVDPKELPDYKPPFFAGSSRADLDGNIWIRTIPTRAIPGGPIFDVINRKGELVDRVQIPEGRTLVGFGAGVVYLTSREGGTPTGPMILEKARVH